MVEYGFIEIGTLRERESIEMWNLLNKNRKYFIDYLIFIVFPNRLAENVR